MYEANASRWVTKIRRAVESANGRLKNSKFLDIVVSSTQVRFIGDDVRIVGLMFKAFRPLRLVY